MFFIPAKVNIGSMKINNPDHLSAVSLGPNFIINENVSGKKNQGFGQQSADFTIIAVPIQITIDNEIMDSPSIKINK